MKMTIQGKNILDDEGTIYAICDIPEKALEIMKKGWYLNNVKRQYTASARMFARVEQLPGFQWGQSKQGGF